MAFATRFVRKSIAYLPSTAPRVTPRPRASLGAGAGMPELGASFFAGFAGFSSRAIDGDEIFLPAVYKSEGGRPFKLKGMIKGNPISLLLSTGTPASFVDSQVAKELGLKCIPTATSKVALANGNSTISCNTCPSVAWEMGGNSFESELRCLDLGDKCDIILGTDWMHLSTVQLGFALRKTRLASPPTASRSFYRLNQITILGECWF